MLGFSEVNSYRNKFIYIQVMLNYIDLYVIWFYYSWIITMIIDILISCSHALHNNYDTYFNFSCYPSQPAFTCSKLTIETLECSSVSLVNFEHVNAGWDVFTWFKSTDLFDIRTNVHNSQELGGKWLKQIFHSIYAQFLVTSIILLT